MASEDQCTRFVQQSTLRKTAHSCATSRKANDNTLVVESMASSAKVPRRYMVWLFNHTWFVHVALHVFLYTTAGDVVCGPW